MQDLPRVSIIIPTACDVRRKDLLLRAIDGLHAQTPARPEIIVVANGQRCDPQLLEALRRDNRIRFIYEPVGSAPRAQRIGREAVRTEFFGFLDDDDEYLPGAIALRVAHLDEHPELDGVVCNGVRVKDGVESMFMSEMASFANDPLAALLRVNWLFSCGFLLRTQKVGLEFFDDRFSYMEWTLLAFKLALNRRMGFLDAMTFRLHDAPGALGKSAAYARTQVDVMSEILRMALPKAVRTGMRRKLGASHHHLSDMYRSQGDYRLAWQHHLQSLRYPGGLAYAGYTRRLLVPSHD